MLFEAPVAALLAEQAGPGITGTQGARRVALTALALALVLPLLWRRPAPFLVFWVVFGAALGQALISPELNDDLALLISFYMVGFSLSFAATAMLGYYARDRAARIERERRQEADHAAAAERARVAREMHDIVAHNIAVMIALADGAAEPGPGSGPHEPRLGDRPFGPHRDAPTARHPASARGRRVRERAAARPR